MIVKRAYADLHLHTVASDGTQTVEDIVRRAQASALHCVAITDHDTIDPRFDRRVREMSGVEVVTGVEVKAMFGDVAGELLGYFVDPTSKDLQGLLGPLSSSRDVRMERMVELCQEHIGPEVTLERVLEISGDGNVGRPHLAKALLELGVVESLPEAFDTWIGKGCPCYYAIEKPSFEDALRILKRAGGAVSVAHPCLMKVEDWPAALDEWKAAGLDGVESVYPYSDSRNLTLAPARMAQLAHERDFLVTGGSDDHGPESTKMGLGGIRLPYIHVEALKERAGLA